MKNRLKMRHKLQTGALGVFVCVVLVIVFGLISLQNISSTSLDLYLSNSKQHIEEARQLAYAGLRHYTHNIGNDDAIQQLIDSHRGDTRIIGECSFTVPLPATLRPQVQLASPTTPDNTRQDIDITGIVVPYNCDHAISKNNYRATFEIVASVNCSNNNGLDSGCVKRSFVFNRENSNGLTYKTIKTPPPPPRPPRPRGPRKPPDEGGKQGEKKPPRKPRPPETQGPTEEIKAEPTNSKGKHEVGF